MYRYEEYDLYGLRDFTMDRQADKVDRLEMTEFFRMLSRSVSGASRQSIPQGELELGGCRHH